MVLTLIASFSVHLVTRAYWVGLVGLDSVFPDGVDWEKVNYGPLAKKVYRERMPSLPYLARRADDVGSAIFSVAFWIITIFLFSIVFGLVFGAVGWVLSKTVLPGVAPTVILVGFALVLGLVPGVAIVTEKAMGDRLDPDGRVAAAIERALAGYYYASAAALYFPIQFTLFSRIPKKIVWPSAVLLFIGLFGTLLFVETTRTGAFVYSANAWLPDRPGRRAVADDHFEDRRSEGAPVPYIQSDIVEGPYVRLTVPLLAIQYLDRLRAVCPDLEPLGSAGIVDATATEPPPDPSGEARLLDCLGRIWTVVLDGRVVTPEWDLVWSSGRGTSALVAYLPTADLAPGAHLLELERAPSPEGDEGVDDDGAETAEDADDRPRARYFIRFRI